MTQNITNGTDAKMSLFSMAAKNRTAVEQPGRSFESYLKTDKMDQSEDVDTVRGSREVENRAEVISQSDARAEKAGDSQKPDEQMSTDIEQKDDGRVTSMKPGQTEPEEIPEETIETLATAIMGFLSEVAQDVLSVNTEDIQEWMTVNEMSLADMLDPKNLQQMLMDLTGLSDVADFLTDDAALGQWNQIQGMLNDFMQNNQELLTQMQNWEVEQAPELFAARQEAEQVVLQDVSEQPVEADEQEFALGQPTAEEQIADVAPNNEESSEFQTERRSNGGRTEGRSENHVKDDMNLNNGFLDRMNSAIGQAVEAMDAGAGARQASHILNQVVSQIRVTMTQEVSSMDFMLNPENLGRVHISVADRGGVMTAQITVQNLEAKEALEGQMIILQQTFEEQGLRVESVEVNVSEFTFGEEGQNGNSQTEDGNGSGRRSRSLRFEDSLSVDESDPDQEEMVVQMMNMTGAQVDYSA